MYRHGHDLVLTFPDLVAVPWFLPGVAGSIAVGFVASQRAAGWLGVHRVLGWGLVVALGLVLSATLTPHHEEASGLATGAFGCDMTRVGLPPLDELLEINDTSLNVLLFVPLGTLLGLVPRSRRKGVAIAGAVALPFIIETTQLVMTPLDRACQSADVVDNLTGLVLGLAIGSIAGFVWARRSDR
jgi:glycopeptide antibiotics resistance protein